MAAVPLLDLASCAPVAAQLCDGKGFLLKTPRANRSLSAHFELVDHDSVPAAAFPASGVKSAVILKPVLADIACFQRTVRYDQQHNQLLLTKPADNCSGTTKETAFNSSYFDAVYDGADARQQLYSEALPLVDALMQGRNAAVLAYGQTGSGKTYQMEGSIDRRCDWGLIPFVVEEILHRVEESRDGNFLVSLSYVEFYKEQLHDLLVDCGKGPGAQLASLGLRQNGEGNYDIAGVQEVVVADLNQVVGLMRAGSRRRHTAAHDLNERSSRSFADVIIKVESMHTVGGKQVTCCSRLHLCDLAGSERQTRTSAAGDRLKEASAINTTLHVLRRVVQARVQQAERRANERPAGAIQPPESLVPYNESKLTKVLKETLSGNAMLLVICCLSQSPSDYADSLATLQFAQACKSLTATPKVRYISGGQIAGVTDDLRSLANADVAAELAAQRDKLMLLQTDVMSQEQELERQRKKVNYLETELVCERAQAQGQRAKQANLALELRLSVEHIIDSTCDLMGAYVAGGGADILGRVLASQLPHLQRALDSPAMLSQLGSQHLLRLVKAFLQVNYSMADGLTRTLEGLFGLLRSPRTSACWGDAVAFCLSEMAAHVTRARQLPAYVLHNFLNMLSGIAKHLGAETAAQLDAAHALAAMAGFLSAAKTAAEANPATDRAHITQRTVTVINVLGDRLFSANRSVTSLPSFQEVAQGVQHFKALLVTAEAQAPAASTNHQAAATSDPARRGTAPAAADNQPGTAALRRKSYALRSRGPVPDSAGQAAHLEPAAIDSPTLLLNFDTLDARDTWLTPFGAGTPDAKWLDERAYEREQLSSTVKPLNFESAAPAAPSSLARFNQRTILSPIQQQAGRPVPSAHRPGLGAKTPSRFYAATEQDKENALVTARLQEALANATPLPNTAVGTQTHMSSTPATSLLELRQRFQLSSLAAGSCLSAIKPSKYSGLGSFLTPAPASKSAAGAAPALGLTPKTAMRNVKDKLALLQ
ncbi:hypothetical protein WJX72_008000 [[Myrmecia] bisecta]|uniref:Kinesin-like protein n=1 Tax=[Myrmecia] bisecta TaxID=41462 RepID=A0AAW1PWA5_9CHLO